MSRSYSFKSMKPKQLKYGRRSVAVVYTSDSTYSNWRDYLEGAYAEPWRNVTSRFGDYPQNTLLKALAITGTACSDWNKIFRALYEGRKPFENLAKEYLQEKLRLEWEFFAEKVAQDNTVHFPPLCPEWLFNYGSQSQQFYVQALNYYWDDIDDAYYKPWEVTRLGHDYPDTVRLRKLGQQARDEIDQVARHSEQYLKREGKR